MELEEKEKKEEEKHPEGAPCQIAIGAITLCEGTLGEVISPKVDQQEELKALRRDYGVLRKKLESKRRFEEIIVGLSSGTARQWFTHAFETHQHVEMCETDLRLILEQLTEGIEILKKLETPRCVLHKFIGLQTMLRSVWEGPLQEASRNLLIKGAFARLADVYSWELVKKVPGFEGWDSQLQKWSIPTATIKQLVKTFPELAKRRAELWTANLSWSASTVARGSSGSASAASGASPPLKRFRTSRSTFGGGRGSSAGGRTFNGICFTCGQQGHIASRCPAASTGGAGSSSGSGGARAAGGRS